MTDRESGLHAATRISVISLSLGLGVGVVALIVSTATGSLAVAAFGIESLVDAGASGLLIWRFRVERREPQRAHRVELRAERIIGCVLLAVGLYLIVASLRSLVVGPGSHESGASLALTALSVITLPGIAHRKLTLSRKLRSRSLRADGILTAVGAILAAVTLVAVALASYTGLDAADPIAALVVAVVLLREAVAAVRARL